MNYMDTQTWIVNESKDISVGYLHLPQSKKPYIVIRKGNVDTCYGQFRNDEQAEMFMKELCEICNVKESD